jgi:hypothetical protein
MVKNSIVAIVIIAIIALAVPVSEVAHRVRYGHFLRPGLHTDVVRGDSDIGTNDTYYARVWNLTFKTIEIEGCRLPGGYVGSGVLYHWDVQRWDVSRNNWSSLHGANNWIPQPLGGSNSNDDYWSKCGNEITRVRPFTTRTLAWVYKDWVTPSDLIRMAIHTSAKTPLDQQMIIYTQMFSIQK